MQKKTGGKVYSGELVKAVANLTDAGAEPARVHAYLIVGHPSGDQQGVEDSMHFAHSLGIRVMLSEFSPLPGTPDGEVYRQWLDLEEPFWHNKTPVVIRSLGIGEISRLKNLAARLNHGLAPATMERIRVPSLENARRGN